MQSRSAIARSVGNPEPFGMRKIGRTEDVPFRSKSLSADLKCEAEASHLAESDTGGGLAEETVEVGAECRDRDNDDDGDQGHHEAVLNGGGATVVPKAATVEPKCERSKVHSGSFQVSRIKLRHVPWSQG